MIAALIYSYDGWISAAYFGGEIKGGGRAVVREAIKGVIIVGGFDFLLHLSVFFYLFIVRSKT